MRQKRSDFHPRVFKLKLLTLTFLCSMVLVFCFCFVLFLVLTMGDVVFLMMWSEGLRNRNTAVYLCCLCPWLALWSSALFRWFKKSARASLAPVIFLTRVSQKHYLAGQEELGWDMGSTGLPQMFLSKNPHTIFSPNRSWFLWVFSRGEIIIKFGEFMQVF